jgi:hypothetical protein
VISWKQNRECPLCAKPIDDPNRAFLTPTAFFPGLGTPFGDFLSEDDPLRAVTRKLVHYECWENWPERDRFAGAWTEWKLGGLEADPESGLAFRSEDLAVAAPCDAVEPADPVRLVFPKGAALLEMPAKDWPEGLGPLEAHARSGLPIVHRALSASMVALDRLFPTLRALVDAVDWTAKKTECALCRKTLGASPAAEACYRIPQPGAWPADPRVRGLRAVAGSLAHTACWLAWPERERFVKLLGEIEVRLARLEADVAVSSFGENLFVRAGRDLARPDARILVGAREARLSVPAREWSAWLTRPADFVARLRPFERDAVFAAHPALAARFPTTSAITDSVDWTAREVEMYQAHADQIDACHKMVQAARGEGVRCPRCLARTSDLVHEIGSGTVDCPRCGSELTPMDLGWLP